MSHKAALRTDTATAPKRASSPRKAALWALVGRGGSEGLRVVNNIVMARLLVPEAFGLMALVNTFVQGLKMFSDIGIGLSIVRSPRGEEPVFRNTAFTLQVIRGIALFLVMAVAAWPIARFYGQPALSGLLVASSLTVLIAGFNATSLATGRRHLRQDQLVGVQIVSQALSVGATVGWALVWPSVWAFVCGAVVSAATMLWMSHRLDPAHRDGFCWEPEARRELLTFGRWIFVSTALTFLAAQADRLVLGKLLDLRALGLYGIAVSIARVPEQLMQVLSNQVLFPVLSKQAAAARSVLRAAMLRRRQKLLLLLGAVLFVPLVLGDVAVGLLYPAEYHRAGAVLSVLAAGTWLVGLNVTAKQALFVIGAPRYNAVATAARVVLVGVGLPLSFAAGGISSAVLVMAFAELPVYIVNSYGLHKEELACTKQDLLASAVMAAVMGASVIVREAFHLPLPWAGLGG